MNRWAALFGLLLMAEPAHAVVTEQWVTDVPGNILIATGTTQLLFGYSVTNGLGGLWLISQVTGQVEWTNYPMAPGAYVYPQAFAPQFHDANGDGIQELYFEAYDPTVGYQLHCLASSTPVMVSEPPPAVSEPRLSLGPAIPNPAQRGVSFSTMVDKPGPIEIRVLDVTGRVVRAMSQKISVPGETTLRWDGLDNAGRVAAAGMYFYEISASDGQAGRSVVWLR